jgi:hypothetical protein
MGKVVQMILSEKTHVKLSLSSFILLLSAVVSFWLYLSDIKTEAEMSIHSIEKDIVSIQQDIIDLQTADMLIIQDQKENRAIVLEVKTDLSSIKTDLKWIIENMKD